MGNMDNKFGFSASKKPTKQLNTNIVHKIMFVNIVNFGVRSVTSVSVTSNYLEKVT